ncbi:hypothetical protein [Streptomyces sp. NBC_01092]|uniref:hypothetical protein n=1 Tax=Streptomyces sp. NBC_01092 TaxID=2903748 RepID=UPI00386E43A8|nr:hypothetical protein OG254_35950 [Streptomyces sp. NBC_01092]
MSALGALGTPVYALELTGGPSGQANDPHAFRDRLHIENSVAEGKPDDRMDKASDSRMPDAYAVHLPADR